MVLNPRLVLQVAMFEVLQSYGQTVSVPAEVCKVIQVKESQKEELTKNQLVHDQRLWDLGDYIVPTVKKVFKDTGIQS